MTPREGVCHEDGQPHRCGRCDRDIIEAHPAATAREEAWKAMVEALRDARMELELLKVEVDAQTGGDDTTKGAMKTIHNIDRALALARSVKGTEA